MSTTELAKVEPNPYAPVVALVTNSVTSVHTRRAYGRALTEFFAWWDRDGRRPLTKAVVQKYVSALREEGRTASSINQRLVAIRKLAQEAADNELIDQATAVAIRRAEGVRKAGTRLGNWLTVKDAQRLLDKPDPSTPKGLRDRAILAVFLGTGLRREEMASLTVEHIQQREGRWVIVDLVGKRQKVRSVPMPSWAKTAIDAWTSAAGIKSGPIFRAIRRGGHIQDVKRTQIGTGEHARTILEGMTAQAIFAVVTEYTAAMGKNFPAVRPHDLRRTYAHLARKGGAPIEQIQLSLGHLSIQTTERYLGIKQDLTTAPCDVLGLHMSAGDD